jgi:hypothetical protein
MRSQSEPVRQACARKIRAGAISSTALKALRPRARRRPRERLFASIWIGLLLKRLARRTPGDRVGDAEGAEEINVR